ncbi:hypothetical protein SAMN05421805_112123 [Saccharopolyspora antimicrobica]|uniref:DUF6779 domain-containing protein n=1 Tax=Saccharopolyspora antimicrobica TaxID=455193 RepID=A0A1I5G6Z7_9PSEU|nr:DUF6779 domain-containing protein [Saccharopolyspora antimicrobica]RKT83902.1 hypothetical protein ATL45_2197 [Saccharopolyspora antimicrobica]SFO31619.1 hypothetical protein SAMN05421805_112123 [Saccharopolyspora antimicrobica]
MSDRGTTETETRAGGSTALWVGALVLAAAATAVLVISDDARLLRLGLVAALWSALVGAFAVARLRHRVAQGEKHAEDRQRIYELELEREIAARREFELEAEAEARRKAAEESDGELKALQAELQRLRTSLEQVLGGDVLFERVALRAESTRVRSLTENSSKLEGQLIQPAPGRELPAAQNTELINRLAGEEHRPKPRPRVKPQAAQAHQSRPVQARRPEKVHPEPKQRPPEPPKPQVEPAPAPAPDPAGAHAEGTSVNDLIAAYGAAPETPRRRRRRA